MRNVDAHGGGSGASTLDPDPVVVCGMAMRLPGGVSNSEQFWDMLIGKRCGSIPAPSSRFNAKGYYSEHKRPGTIQLRRAYFMDHVDIDRFDASHFPFSRKEVEMMDPVQRMLLEVTWECLENAGETDWHGKNVGCYVGSFMEDWSAEMDRDTQHFSAYPAGKWDIMLSNRISYAFDFHGPSMTVRTGCSATLVALNLAEQAVKSGECTSAIIAGSNIFLSAASATKASYGTLGNVLSPDGVCKTFDAGCDGYGRGEAINAIYVKRLSHAIRDGNPIRAILRATATQHDGKKPGLLNPNTHAQEALIRHTYKIGGITDYSETSFFECHGTGTPTGDPTEVSAVERIFGEKGVLIGGVKPNTGHSEGAAALTSVIKVILMLERGIIAPNINFHTANPNIPWAGGRIRVPIEAQPFPSDRRKRVSVNAFGIGGTNAHAILEAYQGPIRPIQHKRGPHLLLFSASNPKSLELLQDKYRQYILAKSPRLEDLAYTLGCRRTHLGHRSFLVADDATNLSSPEGRDLCGSVKARQIVFVFNGQGAQWPTMGRSLIKSNATFRQCIRRLDEALSQLPQPPSWTVEDELSKDAGESRVMDSEYSLPCSTAVQIGIVEILRSWAVRPDAVAGHSSGEIAGAFAAGVLTAEASIITAYFRGRIPKSLGTQRHGTMAAIGLGSQDVAKYLVPGVVVACENSQSSTTISGDAIAVETVAETAKADGVFARLLAVDRAYHSPHMNVYGQAYEDAISPFVNAAAPKIPFFSSVTGDRVTAASELGAKYWHRSLVQPVRFNGSLRRLLQTYGQTTNPVIVEIGARPALRGPIKQILDDFPEINACHIATLDKDGDCTTSMLKAAGRLFCENVSLDYQACMPPGRTLADLPTYTWAHDETFQEEHRLFKAYRDCQFPMHDLLGRQNFETSALEPTWRKVLQVEDLPWLGDHMIGGQIIFPFAGYFSIAEEALRQVSGGVLEAFSARDFAVGAALHLEPGTLVEIHTRLRRLTDDSSYEVRITSWKNDSWTDHCTAVVTAGPFPGKPRSGIQRREFARVLTPQYWYKTVQDRGFTYGPAFRGLDSISVSPTTREATARVSPMNDPSDYLIHPTALDQCFQTLVTAGCHGQHRKAKFVSMPSSVKEIFIRRSKGPFWTSAVSNASDLGEISGSLLAYTEDGEEVMSMTGVRGSQIATQAATDELPLLSTVHWDHHSSFFPFESLRHCEFSELLSESMRVLTHTNPQLRVLEVGCGADTTTRTLLNILRPEKDRQLFSKLTYAASSVEACKQAMATLADVDGIEIGSLISLDGEEALDLEFDSHDVIIVNGACMEALAAKDVLIRLRETLRPTGVVILPPRASGDRLLPIMREAGFDLATVDSTGASTLPLVLRPLTPASSQRISIIVPDGQHQLVDYFKARLSSTVVPWNMLFHTQGVHVPSGDTLVFFLDLAGPHIYNLTDADFTPFIELLCGHRKPIVWVTPLSQTTCRNPALAMIHGLARTLRSELKTDMTVVEMDIGGDPSILSSLLVRIVQSLPHRRFNDEISNPDWEFSVAEDGVKVPRFQWKTAQEELSRCAARQKAESFAKLVPMKPRQLDSLQWLRFPSSKLHPSRVRVEIRAAAVEKIDVNTAKRNVDTAKLSLGLEGAGVITGVGDDVRGLNVGDRVMFLANGVVASHVDVSAGSCIRLDDVLSFDVAASMPIAWTTAFLAVVEFGRIAQSSTVLLSFVRSPLGLALLCILRKVGVKPHVIASAADKSLLESLGVPQSRIISTADDAESVTSHVTTSTLNSKADYIIRLASYKSQPLLHHLSAAGTFLDILDAEPDQSVLPELCRSQAYRMVDLRLLIKEDPEIVERALQGCSSHLSDSRLEWPQLVASFDADDYRGAFQAAEQEENSMSKVVLRLPSANRQRGFRMSPSAVDLRFRADACYLLVGGLGGLGRAVSTWMVEHGARELVFLSRSAGQGPEDATFLEELRSQGCIVKTVAGSVAVADDVSRAVAAAHGAIAGIIQMSMVLRDNAISRMTFAEWKECTSPKVEGTLNLHQALLGHDLDFFLLFSSMSGITGQVGQANYNAANAYLDAFVKYRHALGLPASVVDIGVMGGIGVVAQTENMELRAKAAGYHVLGEQDLLDCLTASILHSRPDPDATSNMSQAVLGLWPGRPLADPSNRVLWKRDARMSAAHSFASQRAEVPDGDEEDGVKTVVLIARTAPERLREEATIRLIVKHIGIAMSELLAQPDAEILPTALLDDIGLDSLNAVELTGWIAQHFSVDLPLFDLIHTPTLWDLALKVSELMLESFGSVA